MRRGGQAPLAVSARCPGGFVPLCVRMTEVLCQGGSVSPVGSTGLAICPHRAYARLPPAAMAFSANWADAAALSKCTCRAYAQPSFPARGALKEGESSATSRHAYARWQRLASQAVCHERRNQVTAAVAMTWRLILEPVEGVEPTTHGLQNRCSAIEPYRR